MRTEPVGGVGDPVEMQRPCGAGQKPQADDGAQQRLIALSILLAGLTIVFLLAVVTLQPFAIHAGALVDRSDRRRLVAIVEASRRVSGLLGEIADGFYGRPSERLQVVATTGTNGKTSTAWWTAQAMSQLGRRCGVIGTLGIGEPASTITSS